MTLGWWRSEAGQAGTDLFSGRSRWKSICCLLVSCLRPDSPTVEASVVLFSLETLIITVSAGAVAALVVGFVTGFYYSATHPSISSHPSLIVMGGLNVPNLSFCPVHQWLSWIIFDIIIMTNIPMITLQERKWRKTCSKCNECKWPQYGNEINNCAFCIANNFQASQNPPKSPNHTSNSRSIFLDLRLDQNWLLCFAGYCCGRKCQKEESNVPYAGTKKCKRPLILIPHSSFLVPDSSFLVPDSWFLIPHLHKQLLRLIHRSRTTCTLRYHFWTRYDLTSYS